MTENTIRNINFDYIFNEIKPITEYGIKTKQEVKPFVKGQEADLKTEYNKIRAFIVLKQRRDLIDVLKHIKNNNLILLYCNTSLIYLKRVRQFISRKHLDFDCQLI